MRWIYLFAIFVVFIRLVILPEVGDALDAGTAVIIADETGVPNSVAGILLRNRLYDTVFEVFVFTLAVLGVQYAFSLHAPERDVFYLRDESMVILARGAAMVCALVFVELALRGHLAPGGGFAAGVAGGSAIGLVGLTADVHVLYARYERWHIASVEKGLVFLILLASSVFLLLPAPLMETGPVSPRMIQLLNMLIAAKVAIGSWTIVLLFIRHRGLL